MFYLSIPPHGYLGVKIYGVHGKGIPCQNVFKTTLQQNIAYAAAVPSHPSPIIEQKPGRTGSGKYILWICHLSVQGQKYLMINLLIVDN